MHELECSRIRTVKLLAGDDGPVLSGELLADSYEPHCGLRWRLVCFSEVSIRFSVKTGSLPRWFKAGLPEGCLMLVVLSSASPFCRVSDEQRAT
jgi:hypothetical protein